MNYKYPIILDTFGKYTSASAMADLNFLRTRIPSYDYFEIYRSLIRFL